MQISSRAVMFWGCRWATRTFNSLQRFSMGLRSGDWLGHSRTLKCFLRSHSFIARAVCLGSLSLIMLKDPATFHLQCPCWWKEVFTQNLTIHGPIHSFLYTDQSSWSLCRKTAPKHDVSTPMLHSRYGVLWMQLSILSPPNTTSWVFTKKFYFLLTVLVIILTPRGEILHGAPDRGRLSVVLYVFHFLIIAPTVDFFTPSCLPIADSVFPAWCRSTILFLVSFDSSLVLAIVEFGVWLFEVVDRCLLYW